MTLRKQTPLHDKWHPRVEGQIRDCIYHHPDWFPLDDEARERMVNSLAKRIVGEFIADSKLATKSISVAMNCGVGPEACRCVGVPHAENEVAAKLPRFFSLWGRK